jgi:hypothetical protein
MGRFIIKQIKSMKPQKNVNFNINEVKVENKKEEIKEQVMTTSEKIEMAQNVLNETPTQFKRVKKDKGLIERTESSKTILTEDNKELLND